jgi:Flp pilus assembly protein TadD
VSAIRFVGILCFSASLYAQFSAPQFSAPQFSAPLLTASGETSIVEQAPEFKARPPISGLVSLRDLLHPVPEKAIREAYAAQQFALANNHPKAIAKFEKAIRIAPAYRDAHLNLGVEYARAGRSVDARAQFQKALDIGPPAAPIYADLALASLAAGEYREAETFARKALELDSGDGAAKRALQYASGH